MKRTTGRLDVVEAGNAELEQRALTIERALAEGAGIAARISRAESDIHRDAAIAKLQSEAEARVEVITEMAGQLMHLTKQVETLTAAKAAPAQLTIPEIPAAPERKPKRKRKPEPVPLTPIPLRLHGNTVVDHIYILLRQNHSQKGEGRTECKVVVGSELARRFRQGHSAMSVTYDPLAMVAVVRATDSPATLPNTSKISRSSGGSLRASGYVWGLDMPKETWAGVLYTPEWNRDLHGYVVDMNPQQGAAV